MSWTRAQKGILGAYRRYAGIPDQDYRDLLYRATGERSAASPKLRQGHFDAVMPLVEVWAHVAHVNGTAVGKMPSCIRNWHYWRRRRKGLGGISTRQRRAIADWWELCGKWMPEEDHSAEYLLGFARTAAARDLESLDDLSDNEASAVVEGLKSLARRLARKATRDASAAVVAAVRSGRMDNAEGMQENGEGTA